MVADYEAAGHLPGGLKFVHPGDMQTIATLTDFLGVNMYTREIKRAEESAENLPQTLFATGEKTEMGWEVHPQSLYRLLLRLYSHYNINKLYITENGASYSDGPDRRGQIHDERRINYLRDHLAACGRAIEAGVPLAGYFQWSLMDNFEWAKGYTQRFGMVWTDYATQQRIPKASAYWYREAIRQNGFAIAEAAEV
jgi:beta-glucosidase